MIWRFGQSPMYVAWSLRWIISFEGNDTKQTGHIHVAVVCTGKCLQKPTSACICTCALPDSIAMKLVEVMLICTVATETWELQP